jgi:hypothetical protein
LQASLLQDDLRTLRDCLLASGKHCSVFGRGYQWGEAWSAAKIFRTTNRN